MDESDISSIVAASNGDVRKAMIDLDMYVLTEAKWLDPQDNLLTVSRVFHEI